MAIKKPIKKDEDVTTIEDVFTDYLEIIVFDDGLYKKAKIEWNLEAKQSKITLGDIAADAEFRAEYEARKLLSEYIMRIRGGKK